MEGPDEALAPDSLEVVRQNMNCQLKSDAIFKWELRSKILLNSLLAEKMAEISPWPREILIKGNV